MYLRAGAVGFGTVSGNSPVAGIAFHRRRIGPFDGNCGRASGCVAVAVSAAAPFVAAVIAAALFECDILRLVDVLACIDDGVTAADGPLVAAFAAERIARWAGVFAVPAAEIGCVPGAAVAAAAIEAAAPDCGCFCPAPLAVAVTVKVAAAAVSVCGCGLAGEIVGIGQIGGFGVVAAAVGCCGEVEDQPPARITGAGGMGKGAVVAVAGAAAVCVGAVVVAMFFAAAACCGVVAVTWRGAVAGAASGWCAQGAAPPLRRGLFEVTVHLGTAAELGRGCLGKRGRPVAEGGGVSGGDRGILDVGGQLDQTVPVRTVICGTPRMAGSTVGAAGVGGQMVAVGPLEAAAGGVPVCGVKRPVVSRASRAVAVVAMERRLSCSA